MLNSETKHTTFNTTTQGDVIMTPLNVTSHTGHSGCAVIHDVSLRERVQG